jgi:hypothetical protein
VPELQGRLRALGLEDVGLRAELRDQLRYSCARTRRAAGAGGGRGRGHGRRRCFEVLLPLRAPLCFSALHIVCVVAARIRGRRRVGALAQRARGAHSGALPRAAAGAAAGAAPTPPTAPPAARSRVHASAAPSQHGAAARPCVTHADTSTYVLLYSDARQRRPTAGRRLKLTAQRTATRPRRRVARFSDWLEPVGTRWPPWGVQAAGRCSKGRGTAAGRTCRSTARASTKEQGQGGTDSRRPLPIEQGQGWMDWRLEHAQLKATAAQTIKSRPCRTQATARSSDSRPGRPCKAPRHERADRARIRGPKYRPRIGSFAPQ